MSFDLLQPGLFSRGKIKRGSNGTRKVEADSSARNMCLQFSKTTSLLWSTSLQEKALNLHSGILPGKKSTTA